MPRHHQILVSITHGQKAVIRRLQLTGSLLLQTLQAGSKPCGIGGTAAPRIALWAPVRKMLIALGQQQVAERGCPRGLLQRFPKSIVGKCCIHGTVQRVLEFGQIHTIQHRVHLRRMNRRTHIGRPLGTVAQPVLSLTNLFALQLAGSSVSKRLTGITGQRGTQEDNLVTIRPARCLLRRQLGRQQQAGSQPATKPVARVHKKHPITGQFHSPGFFADSSQKKSNWQTVWPPSAGVARPSALRQ